MSDKEYYDCLTLVYTFLKKAILSDEKPSKDGYIAGAMNVIETFMKKKGI